MRRGFKAEAERLAIRLRTELGHGSVEALDVERLAGHVGAEVRSAADLVDLADLEELERLQPGAFSAATFQLPRGRVVIVTNPVGTTSARRKSDVAHELAHLLLKHDVRRVQRVGPFTFVDCDPEQEEEANWLAGCLLLPRPLLLAAAKRGDGAEKVAAANEVSVPMARFRLNTSGVYLQAKARRRPPDNARPSAP